MLPIGYSQCDAEGTKGCLLVMANYGYYYAALLNSGLLHIMLGI
jgi:hypothetical protein